MTDEETIAHWIKLSREHRRKSAGPSVLPIAKIGDKHYFVDERLKQIRNVLDAMDLLAFETDGDLLVFLHTHGEIVS